MQRIDLADEGTRLDSVCGQAGRFGDGEVPRIYKVPIEQVDEGATSNGRGYILGGIRCVTGAKQVRLMKVSKNPIHRGKSALTK